MANLSETETYEAGIYQLETSDKLMGGAEGISNRQARQLANRTAWLKANGLAASSGTFAATLHMNSNPTLTTAETNVTAEATGSYVRVGDMVWITLEDTITQYSSHALWFITGLPFAAAQKSIFAVGDARGVKFRWDTSSIDPGRLFASVDVGSTRLDLRSTRYDLGLWMSHWGTTRRTDVPIRYEISGWYPTSAGA